MIFCGPGLKYAFRYPFNKKTHSTWLDALRWSPTGPFLFGGVSPRPQIYPKMNLFKYSHVTNNIRYLLIYYSVPSFLRRCCLSNRLLDYAKMICCGIILQSVNNFPNTRMGDTQASTEFVVPTFHSIRCPRQALDNSQIYVPQIWRKYWVISSGLLWLSNICVFKIIQYWLLR